MSVTVVEEAWHVTVDEGPGSSVVVVEDAQQSGVVVVSEGVEGPPGAKGETGDTGPAGTTHHAGLDDTATSGHPASAVTVTPTGSIASTDVQAALAEIASEYAAGDTAVASAAASALASHEADTSNVHGIVDTTALVLTGDARLSDSRSPNGAAGGVLGGTYPNPAFASDMATQAELDAEAAARAAADAALQPLDSDLSAIAALSTTAFGRSLLALADAAAGRTAFGLGSAAVAATGDFDAAGAAAAAQAASQPLDSDLTAIAALTTISYGRAFLALADAAAARTALALGTAATHPVADFLQTSNNLSDVTAATARTNLGLGTAAVKDTGTGAVQVVLGNDARLTDTRTPTDGSVTDAKVSASAAIAKSKLASLAIVNADVDAAAAIAYSKLALGTSIVNADVSASAAIAESKLSLASDAAVGTASRRTLGDGATQAAQGSKRARVLGSVVSAVTAVSTTNETTMCSFTVPGGSVAAGDHLRAVLKTDWLNNTGSNVNYSWRFKFGATTFASLLTSAQTANSARRYVFFVFDIIILDSTHQEIVGLWSQVLTATPGTWASATPLIAAAATAEDTSTDKAFAFTIQMGTSNSLADYVLRAAVLELIKA